MIGLFGKLALLYMRINLRKLERDNQKAQVPTLMASHHFFPSRINPFASFQSVLNKVVDQGLSNRTFVRVFQFTFDRPHQKSAETSTNAEPSVLEPETTTFFLFIESKKNILPFTSMAAAHPIQSWLHILSLGNVVAIMTGYPLASASTYQSFNVTYHEWRGEAKCG